MQCRSISYWCHFVTYPVIYFEVKYIWKSMIFFRKCSRNRGSRGFWIRKFCVVFRRTVVLKSCNLNFVHFFMLLRRLNLQMLHLDTVVFFRDSRVKLSGLKSRNGVKLSQDRSTSKLVHTQLDWLCNGINWIEAPVISQWTPRSLFLSGKHIPCSPNWWDHLITKVAG